jgi:RNA polymerase sigma-70 factor (ECF subfamily)
MESAALDRLAVRIQGGDREAFRAMFLACERPVRLFLSAHATSPELVDEALQATFIACFESIATYEPRGTFLYWLKGIARNRLLKELRERARHARLTADALEQQLAGDDADALERGEEHDLVRLERCLGQVSPPVRALLTRRYVERAAVKDLAVTLGRTETWVSVTLHRARAFLRTCLSRQEAT